MIIWFGIAPFVDTVIGMKALAYRAYWGIMHAFGWWVGSARVGVGTGAYDAVCFRFRDIIVHRRRRTRHLPKSAFMKRIVQAHRLHNAVEIRQGNVSVGLLVA